MSITLRDFLNFPFNGGKGIRTNQLDGLIQLDQVVAAIRDGSIILPDETTGNLPDASMNQGRFALTDSGVALSRNHSIDAVVTFKLFGPDRVVASGEPAISSKEMLYAGSFPNTAELPAIADYAVGAYLWSVSAQNWFHKDSANQQNWRQSNHPGAPLVFNFFIYGTIEEARNHVHGVGNWQPNGHSVAIIGHGNGQLAYVLTDYTAPVTDHWQWDPLGLTQADIQAHIAQHDTATDAHDDIRSLISTERGRIDALDGVEIEAYSSSATYSRGSANSIVTHSNGLFIYISATERSSGHDPDEHPGYWLRLNEGVTYEVITSGSHRISARTLVVDGNTDAVYLCTTTQETPRDLAYIEAQAESIGGTFINLTNLIPTTWKGPHVIGQSYEAGDRVTTNANTRIYTARVDTGETPPHADWIQTGPVGSGGGSDLAVSDEGTSLTTAATGFDFTGGGVTATQSGGVVTVDVPSAGGGGISETDADARYLNEASNLSDLDDVAAARTALGLGTAALQPSNAFVTLDSADARYLNETSNLSDLPNAATARTNLELGTAATRDTGTSENNVPILDASGDIDAAIIPIDNTLQVDGSGNLGVEISTVIDLLDEDIRYYSTDTTREDARQASKGIVFLDTSRYAKRIHSVEWDFEGDGVGHNYTTFFVRIDSNDDIDFVYGESETLFNVGTSGTRRFNFDSSGLRIPGSVERLGLFITRTGSDDTWETKVYRGQPASDSPRESYPDASVDFPFWRSARFASGRPEPGEHIDNYITNGEIYGYPKIRYTLELEHASLVGDGNITPAHIDSGSSADGTVLTADGSGGSAYEALPAGLTESEVDARVTAGVLDFAETGNTDDVPVGKIPGGITHIESGATYASSDNVIRVSTTETVRGGDGILFVVPSPFGTDATQAISLAINGQSNSEFPLHDRNGDALHEDDLTVGSVYIAISDADSWDILVLPAGSGTGGLTTVATDDTITGDGTSGDPLSVAISWGFQLDTVIVPELNQDAISTARIVLEDSGLTHYLTFLGWTAANLNMISHLPVGAHIGLRQGVTTRILEVQAEWDSTNDRYQVINVNTGILTESASGTATELLLTAGVGGTGVATGFTELRAPATLDVAQTWTATGATIPAADGDEWVRMNGNFDGEVPENFEFLSSRLRSLAEHLVGGSSTTGDVERLQFHDGSVFQRVFLAQTAAGELIMRHETATQSLGNLSVYSYSAIAGAGSFKRSTILDTATVSTTAWTEVTLTETLAAGAILEVVAAQYTGADNSGAFSPAFITSDELLSQATGVSAAPTNGVGSAGLKIHSPNATNGNAFGHDTLRIRLSDEGDKLWVRSGRTTATFNRLSIHKLLPTAVAAGESGQESPGNEGVAQLTPNLVEITLWKWVLTTDGKPADPAAHWRFDDEWDGTTPQSADGGGWYINRANALDEADNNPAFSEDTWTLWTANEQVRRRVVNEAYSYVDGGYTVTAVWDIQYSTDGVTWVSTEPDLNAYVRYRDQETGLFGPIIPVGTNVGSNDWIAIRTNDLVYPAGANVDELDAVYDFGNFSELLFVVAGYRSVSVDDGLGGTIIVGVNGPWHQYIVSRGGGWPTADASENEDNNDADDGSCFQFTYFATNTGVGLQIWERGDDYVDPGNPPFLQDDGEPPRQLGGHFKIVSTDGDEAHVTKFRFFAFSHQFARTQMSIFARYRNGRP